MNATMNAEELVLQSGALEGETAERILGWAAELAGERLVVTSSFSDAVLVHLVHHVIPSARVVFIDTGFHFPETLAFVDRIARRYDISVEKVSAGLPADVSPCGSPDCCQRRKVDPLAGVLAGQTAWVTGIRRDETPERSDSPIVSFDERYGVIKVNPLANWTDDDVAGYMERHTLPVHPLVFEGYLSIGCAPVTAPVADPDDPRSGRWPGSDKTECGLHF